MSEAKNTALGSRARFGYPTTATEKYGMDLQSNFKSTKGDYDDDHSHSYQIASFMRQPKPPRRNAHRPEASKKAAVWWTAA